MEATLTTLNEEKEARAEGRLLHDAPLVVPMDREIEASKPSFEGVSIVQCFHTVTVT